MPDSLRKQHEQAPRSAISHADYRDLSPCNPLTYCKADSLLIEHIERHWSRRPNPPHPRGNYRPRSKATQR
jgi:hypothetical protein